jgi:hypothetical protein
MNSHGKTFFMAVALTLTLILCTPVFAQGPADLTVADPPAATPAATPDPVPPANPVPQYPIGGTTGGDWRVAISIYGWFPGVHGTAGALDHNASIHQSFSDVFHTLKGLIPIAVEADKGRFVMPIDYLWMKMGVDNGIPINDFGQTSINTHLTESIFTPKIGYRVVDGDHVKVDVLGGIRYWYLGLNNTLEPSGLGNSRSANWVDGLGGARFIFPLGDKAALTVAGDAGAGGANLDYQVLGLLNYQFTQKWGLAVGWRYLDVNYRPTNKQFVFDMVTNGPIAGLNYTFGGKPPVPPSASCSASPREVFPGDPVNATIVTQYFNPKHTVTYKWGGTGGKISGTGTTANIDTASLAPGSYTVTATATDEKEKKNNVASCSSSFTVKARPNYPPTASCSASSRAIAVNQSATVSITATSPESRPLTYAWTSTGGQLSGTGTSATLTATNADAGNTITVTGTATDDHNLSTSCTASVTVPPVQKVSEIEDWGECTFEKNPKKPWRVDNDCKDVLDKLALRVQQMPNGKVAIVGYTDQEEVVNADQLGAQRAVNIKYYLTTDEIGPKLDPTRLEPRKGGAKGKTAHFYFVPQGVTYSAEESVTVDESVVQGQSRSAGVSKRAKQKKATPATAQ